MPRSMVVSVPNWDIFKGPKEITRSRRKPQPVEQELVEEGPQEQPEDTSATEEDEQVTEEKLAKIAQRKAVGKERRSKKRNERPVATKDDLPVRVPKRKKTAVSNPKAAGTSKGNVSESNPVSNAEAQEPPIDYTKPLNVVLPSPQHISSSSSEGTSSDTSTDSSELLRKSSKYLKKTQKKTPKKTKNISPEENIIIDTSILDHLTTHLSGDAFTQSNLDSPNHPINKFVITTSEPLQDPPVQEPPIIIVQTPPHNTVVPEQENPPTSSPAIQDEVMTHSEDHIASPKPSEQPPPHLPEQIITDEPIQNTPEQEHHTTTEQPPSEHQNTQTPPRTPLTHGPTYKPLTVDELILPVDFALPIQERLMKEAINIDDKPIPLSLSPEHSIDLRKIKITPLKRKRPEPTIPFNKSQPFFNPISEPNLELINIAISISLKRLKCMEKETLIFPSNVDAEIRDLEGKFSETLKLLGDHVKERIKGKGMDAISHIMDSSNHSHAPRLTFFNYEEECQRLESIGPSVEEAARLLEEEEKYNQLVDDAEQARIAAEAEHKRLAEQEAINLVVDGAVQIAVVETAKILENQATEEDHTMLDQNVNEAGSDKDKAPIVDKTPPSSPPKIIQGSPSSTLPPAIQKALHDIREEMKNEIDELRADFREDLTRSGEATNRRLEAMMEMLLKLTQNQPNP
ncbi:hypothetical protein QL285_027353 [Trifolium repens]|nr:hypothetical protein QL285_027353 [Trifolium repens]